MNCFYHHYYFGQLEDKVFQGITSILEEYNDFKPAGIETGNVNGERQQPHKNPALRQSDLCWVNEERMYNLIFPLITHANAYCEWNFELSGIEWLQYTKYEVGQFYNWHLDEQYWPKQFRTDTIRKLSFTLLLNDDFEGGEFEMLTQGVETIPLIKGSMIVFHSDQPHRVCPVTSGTRKSLVGWMQGPPWK